MRQLFLIAIFSMNTLFFAALADSPLTSTDFAVAYKTESIVKKAQTADGVLNSKLMKYLASNGPIDMKMAVINTIGWDSNGKNNAELFLAYLKKTKKYTDDADVLAKASGDDLLCLGYLSALDNYFDVTKALEWSTAAVKKNPSSYTFNIINGLIAAQLAFDTSWCALFMAVDNVRQNTGLTMDMKAEAVTIIFEYMDLYATECE